MQTSQRGAVHLLVPLVLLIGIIATIYLATHPTLFRPKAGGGNDLSQAVSVNGKQCKNNECETDSANIEIKVDVNGLNQ